MSKRALLGTLPILQAYANLFALREITRCLPNPILIIPSRVRKSIFEIDVASIIETQDCVLSFRIDPGKHASVIHGYNLDFHFLPNVKDEPRPERARLVQQDDSGFAVSFQS